MNLLATVLAAAVHAAGYAPVDPAIFREKAAGERTSFLVVLREKADLSGAAAIADRGARRRFVYESLRATAEVSQAPLLARLARSGIRHRAHFLVNMIEVEGGEATARALSRDPSVLAVTANRPAQLSRMTPSLGQRRSSAGIEPNVALVGAPDLWARGVTGQGIVIGIADTGIDWEHPALRAQYRGWDGAAASHDYNWHDAVHDGQPMNACGSDSVEPCDDEGHGTAVTGLAVGDDGGENRVGVAPGARWIGCRNMDIGAGTPARYVECFEFFLAPTDIAGGDPRPELGADIVNNSWTCQEEEGCTDPEVLRASVEALRAAGIAESFAAGNSGPACSSLAAVPPIYDAAFAVGATDLADTIAIFSARGPVLRDGSHRIKPDIVAPGVGVRTSSARSFPLDPYEIFGGTSGASPHVAGAMALLWSAVPLLAGQVDATEEVLEAAAVRLTSGISCGGVAGDAAPNPVFGWGRLDIAAAFALAAERASPDLPAGTRPQPRVVPERP